MLRFEILKDLDLLPLVVDIYNQSIPSRKSTADTAPITVESRIDWFKLHQSKELPIFLGYDNQNQIIGWGSLNPFFVGRPAYHLTKEISIYLAQNRLGLGYGQLFIDKLTDYAQKIGTQNLIGLIFQHNTTSIQLFKKNDFQLWGVLPEIAIIDDSNYSLTIYGKSLNQN